MKNKTERELFLKNYTAWHKDECAKAFGITFYTHRFKNGAQVVVTECEIVDYSGKPSVQTRYNLIISDTDEYNPFDENGGHSAREFLTYNLSGTGISTIVDYMTKRRNEI